MEFWEFVEFAQSLSFIIKIINFKQNPDKIIHV